LNGDTISVQLSKQGYNRNVQITVSPTDPKYFYSDWKGADPTRFSARLRAAALALYNQGCFDTFRVIHQDGLLTIELVSTEKVLYKKVAKSQYTDGVRININFHNEFNPPASASYVGKGQSRAITVIFNNKEFTASYLHENPSETDREMQSIRFSKALKNEFKTVFPDGLGYFSIKLGSSVSEFIFDAVEDTGQAATEIFAKKYIRQNQGNLKDLDIDRLRRERLKRYAQNKQASKQEANARSVNRSDPILKEDIKQLYCYKCQICSEQIKKVGWSMGLDEQQKFGHLSADAHHVVPLESKGLDIPSNIICVCPNCHRRLHTGELIIGFGPEGPVCNNQITGEQLTLTIDSDHSFGTRIEE
jgi:hypothetical protein